MVETRKLATVERGRVLKRRIVDKDGRHRTVPAVELQSPTFADDLLALFTRNVERARRENKRILGVRDRAPGGT